jgi:hypothetical protein
MYPGVASEQNMQIGALVPALDSHTLAFGNYRGNRQPISTENLKHNDPVALLRRATNRCFDAAEDSTEMSSQRDYH